MSLKLPVLQVAASQQLAEGGHAPLSGIAPALHGLCDQLLVAVAAEGTASSMLLSTSRQCCIQQAKFHSCWWLGAHHSSWSEHCSTSKSSISAMSEPS